MQEVVENIKAIEQEGEELEIAFNSKYLMDGRNPTSQR